MNFQEISKLAFELAQEEGLKLQSIERAPQRGTNGTCSHDGKIKIKMQNSPSMWQVTKDHNNLRVLAHELAHLKHFNHSKEFWEYNEELCKKLSAKIGQVIKPVRVMM